MDMLPTQEDKHKALLKKIVSLSFNIKEIISFRLTDIV